MGNATLTKLLKISSLAPRQVKDMCSRPTMKSNEHTLHPVVETAQPEYGRLLTLCSALVGARRVGPRLCFFFCRGGTPLPAAPFFHPRKAAAPQGLTTK